MSSPTRRATIALTAAVIGILLWRLRPDAGRVDPADEPADEPAAMRRLATWTPAPPTGEFARLAAYTWAAPLTAAGLVLGAVAGTRPRVHEGALLFSHAGGLAARMLRWRRFSAATLGHVIIALDEPDPHLLAHELTHVRQAERFGPLFAPLYLLALLRYGYRRSPFERAAYLAGQRSRERRREPA